MRYDKFNCAYCGKESEKYAGHLKRSASIGAPVYCGKECAGLGRRKNISIEEKKRLKSEYDRKRLEANRDKINEEKRQHYYANRDEILAKQVVYRKKHMQRHVEYCRRPEYKKYKQEYDQQYHAKNKYGEFAQAFLVLKEIENIVDKREAFKEKEKYNYCSQKRKRQWQQKKN